MKVSQDTGYTRVAGASQVKDFLDHMSRHASGSILLDREEGVLHPAAIVRNEPEEPLVFSIDRDDGPVESIRSGAQFRLMGQSAGKLVQSDWLEASECTELHGVVQCVCDYPEALEVLQRRDAYRAPLRQGIHCDVMLQDASGKMRIPGDLVNLSLNGCMVGLDSGSAKPLAAEDRLDLTFHFPNGHEFSIEAAIRHQKQDAEEGRSLVGMEFHGPNPEQSRELWYFVREIERESNRSAADEGGAVPTSPLFAGGRRADSPAGRGPAARDLSSYPSVTARELAQVAALLQGQVKLLRDGDNLDSAILGEQAERLQKLLQEDREAVLFALVCLVQEDSLLRHCLGVAIRLADWQGQSLSASARTSLLAGAMVHDLGRALWPPTLGLSISASSDLQGHVDTLLERLANCQWLERGMGRSVVAQANERLDGSGYPRGLRGDDLGPVVRALNVADEADLLAQVWNDHSPQPVTTIYRHLLRQPERFDARQVKSYIEHFGRLPVGTLLRFKSGELAWVQRLDQSGRPIQAQRALEASPPTAATLGDVLVGRALKGLGDPAEVVVPSYPA